MIPKIIHQFWIGPKKRPDHLISTWRKLNPTWEHVLWTEDNLPSDFILQHKINEMQQYPGKVDMMRYEILMRYGGFCVDADAECVSPLDDFLTENEAFTCWENEWKRPNLLSVGYMAATPGNQFFKYVVNELLYKHYNPLESAWKTVGNQHLSDVYFKYRDHYTKLKIYPSYYFLPEHHSGWKYSGSEKIYARQHWGSTHGSSLYA